MSIGKGIAIASIWISAAIIAVFAGYVVAVVICAVIGTLMVATDN